MIARGVYRLLLWLIFPLIWLYLLKRSQKQPAYRDFWLERLGYYSLAIQQQCLQLNTHVNDLAGINFSEYQALSRSDEPKALSDSDADSLVRRRSRPTSCVKPIWLHAVSVGEMRASAPVIAALRQKYPQRRLLLSCMTPTGRETAQELFGDFATIVFLPYDYPSAIRRFLRTFQPQCGVVMETEIWPNLIHECAAAGIPLVLANARLSEKSYLGYRKVRCLLRPAMARWAQVLAQSPADADRLAQLGATNPQIMGSVKFDNQPDAAQIALGQSWRAQFGARPVVLLASSREGEEAELLAQWRTLFSHTLFSQHAPLLIIVPRHPQRFDAVADLIQNQGLRLQRRSQWQGDSAIDTDVLLGDSMGEMTAWFACADLTIMGGSLLPFGCQNFIEACAVGCPVLLGSHTYNFSAASEAAIAAGAAWQAPNLAELWPEIQRLLADSARQQQMSKAAKTFAQAHRGATDLLVKSLGIYL